MNILTLLFLIVLISGAVEPKNGWKKKIKPHWTKYEEENHSENQGIDKEKEEDNNQSEQGNHGQNDVYRKEISDDPEKAFQDLAKEVITHDQIISKYCVKNTHIKASEIYGNYNYKLIIPVNLDIDLIQVKIKHRVIYVKGDVPNIDERWNGDNNDHFNYITRLPEFLEMKKASWILRDSMIEITIPYKFFFTKEIIKSCDVDYKIDDSEFIVPEGTGKPDIDQSIIDDIFATNGNKVSKRMAELI